MPAYMELFASRHEADVDGYFLANKQAATLGTAVATTSLAPSLRAQSSSTSNAPVTHYAPSSIANDTLVMCRARADIAPRRHMPRDAHACTYNTLIMYCNNCMLPAVDAELEQRRLLARASG